MNFARTSRICEKNKDICFFSYWILFSLYFVINYPLSTTQGDCFASCENVFQSIWCTIPPKFIVWILNSTLAFKPNSSIILTLLAVYFQLASSNYSYIVEPYNFQLNAVNKTIHLTNFPSLLLFISLNTWASTWYIFPLTKSYFKLDHVYCQQNFWIFVHNSVQSLIKTNQPLVFVVRSINMPWWIPCQPW